MKNRDHSHVSVKGFCKGCTGFLWFQAQRGPQRCTWITSSCLRCETLGLARLSGCLGSHRWDLGIHQGFICHQRLKNRICQQTSSHCFPRGWRVCGHLLFPSQVGEISTEGQSSGRYCHPRAVHLNNRKHSVTFAMFRWFKASCRYCSHTGRECTMGQWPAHGDPARNVPEICTL